MGKDYSREGLLAFLKEAAIAGYLNPATARSRRTAAEQLLNQLSDQEAADLRELDVDDLAARCHKLQGSTIRREALTLYADRLKAALVDYLSYLENPDRFVSVGGEQRQLRRRGEQAQRTEEERALEEIRLGVTHYRPDIMPVAIRPDLVVYLHNLPPDLTAREARKIARVVEALADGEGDAS